MFYHKPGVKLSFNNQPSVQPTVRSTVQVPFQPTAQPPLFKKRKYEDHDNQNHSDQRIINKEGKHNQEDSPNVNEMISTLKSNNLKFVNCSFNNCTFNISSCVCNRENKS